jgi:hypothetical protein
MLCKTFQFFEHLYPDEFYTQILFRKQMATSSEFGAEQS